MPRLPLLYVWWSRRVISRVLTKVGMCQVLSCTGERRDAGCSQLGLPPFSEGPEAEHMDIPDLIERYYAHLNEYLADGEIPDCLHYVPQGEGQEPTFRLCDADKCLYLVWLREQGYITKAEWRWLWDDLDTQEAGLVACTCCQAPTWSECPCTRVHCPSCGRCNEHCRCADDAAREA